MSQAVHEIDYKQPKLEEPVVPATDDSQLHSIESSRLFIFDRSTQRNFLIDSGSDVSAIPISSFPDFRFKKPIYTCTAANGTAVNVYGTKLLRVDLGLRRNFDYPFILASVTKPIIGADFLKQTGLVIDLRNKRLVDPITEVFVKGTARP